MHQVPTTGPTNPQFIPPQQAQQSTVQNFMPNPAHNRGPPLGARPPMSKEEKMRQLAEECGISPKMFALAKMMCESDK